MRTRLPVLLIPVLWVVTLILTALTSVPTSSLDNTSPALADTTRPWRWPETSENLRVLSPTTTAAELQATMLSFTRGLGVRCSHCHVGEEGQDLRFYDFASDERPNKNIARDMMRMVRAINNDHLAIIDALPQDRVQVTCTTCHRGVERPLQLEDILVATHQTHGIGAALTEYRNLHAQYYGSGSYDFHPRVLNRFARTLMRDYLNDAITTYRFLLDEHPDFMQAYGSLAQGYAAQGNTEQAIATLERALARSPQPPWSELLQQQLDQLKNP